MYKLGIKTGQNDILQKCNTVKCTFDTLSTFSLWYFCTNYLLFYLSEGCEYFFNHYYIDSIDTVKSSKSRNWFLTVCFPKHVGHVSYFTQMLTAEYNLIMKESDSAQGGSMTESKMHTHGASRCCCLFPRQTVLMCRWLIQTFQEDIWLDCTHQGQLFPHPV